ncbi:thiamine pyrophosphate-binding protein, partial [Kitasatospora sp. NPDC098663]|uniref:thiamine pyrophosphate-binding protein n=1 Tax=Kitasatospora sp. NPDC098663 TaxID=3364096 RepID=UPI00382FB58D
MTESPVTIHSTETTEPTPAPVTPDARTGPVEPGMTGAQALIRSLEAVGVDTVFGIPGGAILPAYDPLMDSAKVRHILVRH